MAKVQAVKLCCATKHAITFHPVPDSGIISAVKASIVYCDERAAHFQRVDVNPADCGICESGSRFAAAADRLRDFATVELLCADLGITRKDLN